MIKALLAIALLGIDYNGINQYSDSPNFTNTAQITKVVWIYNRAPAGAQIIIQQEVVNTQPTLLISNTDEVGQRGGGTATRSQTFLPRNQWVFLSSTLDNTDLNFGELFVNPNLDDSPTAPLLPFDNWTPATNVLDVGRYSGAGGGWYINGRLRDIKYYDRRVTRDEVRCIMRGANQIPAKCAWTMLNGAGTNNIHLGYGTAQRTLTDRNGAAGQLDGAPITWHSFGGN